MFLCVPQRVRQKFLNGMENCTKMCRKLLTVIRNSLLNTKLLTLALNERTQSQMYYNKMHVLRRLKRENIWGTESSHNYQWQSLWSMLKSLQHLWQNLIEIKGRIDFGKCQSTRTQSRMRLHTGRIWKLSSTDMVK